MSDLALLGLGFVVSIPAAVGTIGLVLAAIRDGRENDRLEAQRRAGESDSRTALPPAVAGRAR